jgi:hypothetical protein
MHPQHWIEKFDTWRFAHWPDVQLSIGVLGNGRFDRPAKYHQPADGLPSAG